MVTVCSIWGAYWEEQEKSLQDFLGLKFEFSYCGLKPVKIILWGENKPTNLLEFTCIYIRVHIQQRKIKMAIFTIHLC